MTSSQGALSSTDDIIPFVRSKFQIKDYFLREQESFEFRLIPTPNVKEAFKDLVERLKMIGYIAVLRRADSDLILWIGKIVYTPRFHRRISLILLIATLATVSADGFLRYQILNIVQPGYNLFTPVALYTLAIMGIIGTHEFGHKLATYRYRTQSSMPYFIPGIPTLLPTMGAVITSSEPPVNRDALFDLGISGPISGLIVTFIVAIGGALTTIYIPLDKATELMEQRIIEQVNAIDIFNNHLLNIFATVPPGMVPYLSPLTFAASLGFLITFLNLLPAWQLDGGHIARAVLTPNRHRLATYASIIILLLLNFWLMAMLVLILSLRSPEMKPLDDVSPLSRKRKITFIFTVALLMCLYLFTLMDNPFFFR